MSQKQDLLLVGCGDLAQRLVPRLSPVSWQISGLRRSATKLDGVQMHCGDAADPKVMAPLIEKQPSHIILSLAPARGNRLAASDKEYQLKNYRDTYLNPALTIASLVQEYSPKTHLVFVSSTSVYGQNSGEIVDEVSCTNPRRETAKILLQAELAIASSRNPYSILRLSGIYGPGRTRLLEKVAKGNFLPLDQTSWTNRIHSEDCANILTHLITHSKYGTEGFGILIGTDCESVLNIEVEKWLGVQMGVEATYCDSEQYRLEIKQAKGKRCSNQKLRSSGFIFEYPTYKEGYGDMLKIQ